MREQLKCPSANEWRSKMGYTIEWYSALKRKEILIYATIWMKLEDILLREINQSHEDMYLMIPLI